MHGRGLFALMAPKASGLHPTAGRVFILSLALTFAAILLNIIVAQNVFMLGLGWLALYAALVGWRALLRFQSRLSNQPSAFDYLLNGTTAFLSLGLAAFGFAVFSNSGKVMGLVCVGFSLLGVRLVWRPVNAGRPLREVGMVGASHSNDARGIFSRVDRLPCPSVLESRGASSGSFGSPQR